MRVVIAGGHGRIALLLERLLTAGGHEVDALIRNPAQEGDVRSAGARPVVCDLESATLAAVGRVLGGAGAAVFAAGAGPGSGAARKDTVDRGAAVLLAAAAERSGVRRLVQVSSMGAGAPPDPGRGEVWAAYIAAKTAAEADLRGRDLDWTIIRPGVLTDSPATGRVRLAVSVPHAQVSRADVAAVLAELLPGPYRVGQTLELISGDTPIAAAVRG